ncbi:RNA polymerase sigma factor [Acidobacteriota bacterium]
MEEQELMLRVQSGDEVAFGEIVKIYKNKIVNFLWQITSDYQKAVELSQETFMRVYFKADKYKPIAPLSSWIYAIASNLAKTDLKKSRRYIHVPLDDVVNTIPKNIPFSENPSNSDLIRSLRDAIDRLHPRYRVPVILKDIEGFSQEEIAQILDRPLGTIKARISRGRQYLKRDLEETSFKMELCEE